MELPEADLAAAVVKQALADGCRPKISARQTGGSASPADRSQAWAFLTATSGAWAESRKLWCGICGVDAELLRQEALRRGPARGAVVRRGEEPAEEADAEEQDAE